MMWGLNPGPLLFSTITDFRLGLDRQPVPCEHSLTLIIAVASTPS